MSEKRYIISDASKMLDVESHVLRYWEEELEIRIPRNEMGHRYYTENHINLLRNVRDLKKQGYGLRTIRMMIGGNPKELPESPVKSNKMEQFQEIMGNIVSKALRESGRELGKEIGKEISGNICQTVGGDVSKTVIKELDYRLKINEEKEEERYKKLDEAIRMRQKEAKSVKEKRKKEKKSGTISLFRRGKKPQTI